MITGIKIEGWMDSNVKETIIYVSYELAYSHIQQGLSLNEKQQALYHFEHRVNETS